jgi:hypothetical protein
MLCTDACLISCEKVKRSFFLGFTPHLRYVQPCCSSNKVKKNCHKSTIAMHLGEQVRFYWYLVPCKYQVAERAGSLRYPDLPCSTTQCLLTRLVCGCKLRRSKNGGSLAMSQRPIMGLRERAGACRNQNRLDSANVF